ncbi:hypothetical protein [Pseudobutyrivibrio xylanivorans]|nr:hypothetical protein [Pseudobutyrivibrio xylanivorans]
MDKNGLKENSIVYRFFTSAKAEAFIFSLLCATLFTCGLCHWLLDLTYKYYPEHAGQSFYVDFTWVFWILVVVVLYYLVKDYFISKRIVKFDFALAILIQTMVLQGVIAYHDQMYPMIPYTWILPMAYLIGKLAVGSDLSKMNQRIVIIYFSVAVGLFAVTMLDFYNATKYITCFLTDFPTGVWGVFWTEDWHNRCTMEYGLIMITTSIGYAMFKAKENKVALILILIGNILAQFFGYKTQGRENLVLLPLSIMIFVALYLFDNWKGLSNKQRKYFFRGFGCLIALVCIGLLMVVLNVHGLYDRYASSYLADDGGILKNVRFSMDWNGFKAMLQHPLEDYELLEGYEKPHSMLLEYGRVHGLTVYIGLVIFRILLIKDAVILALTKNKYSWIKYLLIPTFIAQNLYYSMEPNGYALRYLWMPGLLVSGMIRAWNDRRNIGLVS